MKSVIDVTANAMWSSDCCGKQDLDFDLISCSSRYYPDHSAICTIEFLNNFCHNECEYVESGIKPVVLAESGIIKGDSEDDIKEKVREWYNVHVVEAFKKALEIISGC